MKVNPYFYNEAYFVPGFNFNSQQYVESLVGLNSWTYDSSCSLITGATYTSEAINQAITDALAAYNMR